MINKVTLIGNLGKDPETRNLESGNTVTGFSMATSESCRDAAGEWKEQTEWHKIVAWGKLAERCALLTKGQTVYVEGKLTTRSYEKDGQKRYITEVVANYVRSIRKSENPSENAPVSREPVAETTESDDNLPF